MLARMKLEMSWMKRQKRTRLPQLKKKIPLKRELEGKRKVADHRKLTKKKRNKKSN